MRSLVSRHGATLRWWSMTLALAWVLKHHYSVASAAELGWMLRPVALLLQLASGHGFSQAPGGEWYSADAGIVLIKSCAGVNFMLMSFLGWCWLMQPAQRSVAGRSPAAQWPRLRWPLRLGAALALAWLTALLVNVVRILLATAAGPALGAGLGEGDAHRLIGLLVYLPALAAQMLLAGRAQRGPATVFATAIYVALMLVTPLLTGSALLQPRLYASHALMLLLVAVPLLAWGLQQWRRPYVTTLAVRRNTGDNQRP
jgi:exosortase K